MGVSKGDSKTLKRVELTGFRALLSLRLQALRLSGNLGKEA